MGQLKTSLVNLQKLLVNNPIKLEQLDKALDAEGERIAGLSHTASQGWDAMLVYLAAKFKKSGTTVHAEAAKTLKQVLDSELAQMIKGMEQWRKDLLAHSANAQAANEKGMKELKDNLAKASAEAKKARGLAEKKKAKWLVSPKYKAKVKEYLTALDQVDKIIASQTTAINQAATLHFDQAWVNKWYTVKADMTVKQIEDNATMDAQNILKAYYANQQKADSYVRKLRDEYKGMAGQIAAMKKWADTADDMEAVT